LLERNSLAFKALLIEGFRAGAVLLCMCLLHVFYFCVCCMLLLHCVVSCMPCVCLSLQVHVCATCHAGVSVA
jgi:hypothetical protein